jgi:hypothetical protein
MQSKLAAYVTTGPVSHPEAAWAKSLGLPHISLGASQILGPVLATLITLMIVTFLVKKVFS